MLNLFLWMGRVCVAASATVARALRIEEDNVLHHMLGEIIDNGVDPGFLRG